MTCRVTVNNDLFKYKMSLNTTSAFYLLLNKIIFFFKSLVDYVVFQENMFLLLYGAKQNYFLLRIYRTKLCKQVAIEKQYDVTEHYPSQQLLHIRPVF